MHCAIFHRSVHGDATGGGAACRDGQTVEVASVPPPPRVLPVLDEVTGFFWTSGAAGRLRFLACSTCATLIHPPAPVCPACLGRAAAPVAVSGRATVHSFTVKDSGKHGNPGMQYNKAADEKSWAMLLDLLKNNLGGGQQE